MMHENVSTFSRCLRIACGVLFALLCVAAAPGRAAADDYPSRSIRLIIPFPPGGSNDVVGRIIANQLGRSLGQQVFVDNRSGAGGVVGSTSRPSRTPTATRCSSFRSRMPSIRGSTRRRSIR